MAFVNTIHPLGPPRLLVSDDWSPERGCGSVRLPGGALLLLQDWQPVMLHVPDGVDAVAAHPEAENAAGCWLEGEGKWMPDTNGGRRRRLRLAHLQPDVRLTFHPAEGTPRSWLLLVDDHDGKPDELVAWTHDEWHSTSHDNGGKWRMKKGRWLRAGKPTPDNVRGEVKMELLTTRLGDA